MKGSEGWHRLGYNSHSVPTALQSIVPRQTKPASGYGINFYAGYQKKYIYVKKAN